VEPTELVAAGARRTALLSRPTGTSRPLVILLPGTGATAAWADDETGWSALAARGDFALAVPDALPPNPAEPPTFLHNPPRWNAGSEDEGGPDDVAFLAALIDDVVARFAADPGRVFVTGFSNGAAMAFRVAAELADRVAAVAPVAGYCQVTDPRPIRPVPTLYIVGAADPLVPVRGGEVRDPWRHRYVRRPPVADTVERWARALGCDPVPTVESDAGGVRVVGHPGPVPFRVVTVEGLGHHWPGGKGRLNPRLAGPPSATVNGTDLVWDFFRNL
jgi:polyhydroxybutyrate depolymerase